MCRLAQQYDRMPLFVEFGKAHGPKSEAFCSATRVSKPRLFKEEWSWLISSDAYTKTNSVMSTAVWMQYRNVQGCPQF